MPPLPVGKNDHSRTRLTNHGSDLQSVLPRVLDSPIGNVERPSPAGTKNLRRIVGLALTILGRTARAHLAAREIENASALPALCGFHQRATAGLLHVVAVRGDGKNIQGLALRKGTHNQSRLPCSTTTFSLTISRCAAISFSVGNTRLTCSSVSTKMMITGNLPPASTRC